MKTRTKYDLDLNKFTQGQKFLKYQLRKNSQNMLGYYAQSIIYCWQGQGRAKGQIHLLSYNFASNCQRLLNLVHVLVYEKPHQI